MRDLTFAFIVSSFILLTLSRSLLTLWQWQRAKLAGGFWPILRGGVRIDANIIAIIAGIPLMASPWIGDSIIAIHVVQGWFIFAWALLVLLEVSTPQFIDEYDTRPNRLYVDYLKHPREVSGMLWKGYKATLLGGVLTLVVMVGIGWAVFDDALPDNPLPWWNDALFTLASAAVVFLAIRGTLKHRPINPSTVAYCGDSMLNTLPLNSLYSVAYAIYGMKNERSATKVYGHLPEDEMNDIVRACAGIKTGAQDIPTLHQQQPSCVRARPLNVVIIVEESLGAQYVGNLGGANLTPCIDRLAQGAWNFTRAYATGTRSVRGLEALSAGFPPTISDAALRLSGAQSKFFTMAQLLKGHGYTSRFLYGGEAHFDNMKNFFLGNGFDKVYDLPSFTSPAFVGTWGASDEDMFDHLHGLLSQPSDQPHFTLAFSVSNHSPWEYPDGRIPPDGDPRTVQNTVRYADWAIGQFFDRARQSDYWENTVFLLVADHDSRASGATRIPVRHFHIPALIVGADTPVRSDDRIVSQIDMPVTLLSLMGLQGEHPMIGHDLTQADKGGRAMMQYKENYGYLKNDQFVVLEPHRDATQYRYTAPDIYDPVTVDPDLAREALAHVLWPNWVYNRRAYTLPALRVVT